MNPVISNNFDIGDCDDGTRLSRRLRQVINDVIRAFNQTASTKWINVSVQTDGLGNIPSRMSLQTPGINPKRCIIGRIQNVTTPGLMPAAQPFLQWGPDGEQVIVDTIVGLDPNTKYAITLEVAG